MHLVTRQEPPGETSASSQLSPTPSEPGRALGRSRRPKPGPFSVIRVATEQMEYSTDFCKLGPQTVC